MVVGGGRDERVEGGRDLWPGYSNVNKRVSSYIQKDRVKTLEASGTSRLFVSTVIYTHRLLFDLVNYFDRQP